MTTIHDRMFAKFTKRARRVLELAEEEARRFNHNYIGTEHLLLGLVVEGEGVAAQALANMDVKVERVRRAIEYIIGRGEYIPPATALTLTPRTVTALKLAVDEARRLNHHHIGTEHQLLGIVREGEGIAVGVLESLDINILKVREQVLTVIREQSSRQSTEELAAKGTAESGSASDAASSTAPDEQSAQPSSSPPRRTRSSRGSTQRRTTSEESPGI